MITSPIQEPSAITVWKAVSEGKKTFNNSRKIPSISLAEAEQKIEAMGITADKFESTKPD